MGEGSSRRDFLKTAAAAAWSGAPPGPNFLIVLCDDLGYGDLACYGHPLIRTPNLDRLAREGVRFTDCYAAAPVCSPARAALLTGRIPDRLGVYNWIPAGSPMHLAREAVTFARLLQARGYATCHSGKWHCNGKFNSPNNPSPPTTASTTGSPPRTTPRPAMPIRSTSCATTGPSARSRATPPRW